VIPARRLRLGSWLTVVIRQRPAPGEDGATQRLFLSATWLLVALGIVVPAWEATVLLHDRRVVARDFACLEARRSAASQRVETAWTSRPPEGGETERIELEAEGIGRVSFPPELTDEETVAAMQALVVAHFRAGHAAHPPAPSAKAVPVPTPAASAPAAPDLSQAEAECRIARGGARRDELRSLGAWRREYAGPPPSPDAERAALGAFLRSALAILAIPALFALRAWWRWLVGA
jgi:hypothetical protein